MQTDFFKCSVCQEDLPIQHNGGTGYAKNEKNEFICYECCGKIDEETMTKDGDYWLYLDTKEKIVSNWPGTLKFNVPYIRIGGHNIAGKQYNFHFKDNQGFVWYGRVCGDFTQLAHVKRYKDMRTYYH